MRVCKGEGGLARAYLRIFISPTPLSIHCFLPEPLSSMVSPYLYSLPRSLNTISSSSSPDVTFGGGDSDGDGGSSGGEGGKGGRE